VDSFYTALGVGAWIVATMAPPAVAVLFWKLAQRVGPSWAVHLALIPFLLLVEWLSIDALFFAAHDDGEGPPGLGFAILPAIGLLIVSVGAYFCALLVRLIIGSQRRA
jgi:drug/metabolite transporter (DMT)-like permease